MLALWMSVVWAQQIEVKRDAGNTVEAGGVTELNFDSRKPVGIHRILAESNALASSTYGGFGTAYGQTTEKLCTAPCTLEVPNGTYRFRVGDNLMFGRPVDVVAGGGVQDWDVRPSHPGSGVAGILMTSVGLGVLIGGGIILAVDEDSRQDPALVGMTAASVPVTVLGFPILLDGFAKAKRRR